jgi:hypothetical protein
MQRQRDAALVSGLPEKTAPDEPRGQKAEKVKQDAVETDLPESAGAFVDYDELEIYEEY